MSRTCRKGGTYHRRIIVEKIVHKETYDKDKDEETEEIKQLMQEPEHERTIMTNYRDCSSKKNALPDIQIKNPRNSKMLTTEGKMIQQVLAQTQTLMKYDIKA